MGRQVTVGLMEFRLAEQRDDAQLTTLVAKPMPGRLSLSMKREPSFWHSLTSLGPPRKAMVADSSHGILALCSFFPWSYSVGGKVERIWTVGDFRADSQSGHRSITGRGWKALREQTQGETTILSLVDDNVAAFRLFSKGRPGWPKLRLLAQLKTLIFPLALLPLPKLTPRLVGLSSTQVMTSLARSGQDFSPVLETTDCGQACPDQQSYVGVFDGVDVLASGALWDLTPCKQVEVAAYSGFYAKLHRLGLLPRPGTALPLVFACFLNGRCPLALRQVAIELARRAKESDKTFLIWGGDRRSEVPFPGYWPRLTYRSSLYQLLWDGDRPLPLPTHAVGYPVAWL